MMGESDLEAAYYDSARTILEQLISKNPEDSRLHSSLGMAYAGLGLSREAVSAGKRGAQLLPIEKEAWRGSIRVLELARIYTTVGEYDAALDELQLLLSLPSEVSVAVLRIHPDWAPLRELRAGGHVGGA